MRLLRGRLTYANVIATLALFLALGGGAVWASGKINSHRLKKNAVTTAKIKRNAVTTAKLHASAVTTAKLKNLAVTNGKLGEAAVDFQKIAPGTSVIAGASGGAPVSSVNGPIPIALSGTTGFTPATGVTDLVSVEARGINLASADKEPCKVLVEPLVNGQRFAIGSGAIELLAPPAGATEPTPVLLGSATGPAGLGQPGVAQTISMRVIGNTDCTEASQVAVYLSVTQLK